jgi:hypothetical protein
MWQAGHNRRLTHLMTLPKRKEETKEMDPLRHSRFGNSIQWLERFKKRQSLDEDGNEAEVLAFA